MFSCSYHLFVSHDNISREVGKPHKCFTLTEVIPTPKVLSSLYLLSYIPFNVILKSLVQGISLQWLFWKTRVNNNSVFLSLLLVVSFQDCHHICKAVLTKNSAMGCCSFWWKYRLKLFENMQITICNISCILFYLWVELHCWKRIKRTESTDDNKKKYIKLLISADVSQLERKKIFTNWTGFLSDLSEFQLLYVKLNCAITGRCELCSWRWRQQRDALTSQRHVLATFIKTDLTKEAPRKFLVIATSLKW